MLSTAQLEGIAAEIVDVAGTVRRDLGPGLYESAYEKLMIHRLRARGRHVEHRKRIHLEADGVDLGHVGTLDLLVDGAVAVELKATALHHPIFTAQLLTFMRLLDTRLGFLINFHAIPFGQGSSVG